MKFTKQTIYIGLFAILYLIVAFSSFWHACAFFGLANNSWMSIILAFAFEIGQAAVLFSLLTSKKDRSRIMPWVLMTMFTLVQVIGNVFSSYKYIISNSVENLRYFKEPIFIWTQLPDDQATVIVTYVVGAILPLAALLLTSMITNYLSDKEEEKKNEQDTIDDEGSGEEVEDTEIDGLKKKLEETEIAHDKLVDEKSEVQKQFNSLLEDYSDQNKELAELKKELEELKHPKIPIIPSNEIIPVQEIEKPEFHEFNYDEVEKHDIKEDKSDEQTDTTKDTNGNNEGEQQEDDKELTKEDTSTVEELDSKKENLINDPDKVKKDIISESDLKQAEQLMNIGFSSSKPKKESHFIN